MDSRETFINMSINMYFIPFKTCFYSSGHTAFQKKERNTPFKVNNSSAIHLLTKKTFGVTITLPAFVWIQGLITITSSEDCFSINARGAPWTMHDVASRREATGPMDTECNGTYFPMHMKTIIYQLSP